MTGRITASRSYSLINGMMSTLGLRRAPKSLTELAEHALHQRVLIQRCERCACRDACSRFQAHAIDIKRAPEFCANRFDLRRPN